MRLGIHLAAQDLLGAGDGERSDVVAKLLARARHLLLDLRLRRGFFPVALFLGRVLGFLDQLRGALLRLRQELGGALARLPDLLVRPLVGQLQRTLALLGRGEAVGDGLLPRLDRAQHVRPDELHREPDERRKDDRLREQRQVDVHACPFLGAGYWNAPASGLAKAKNIAMPRPMMNEASISPSSRNTRPCSGLVSSGCRAAASRKRLHMMPTPMQAPAAPRPTMRPMPIPV